MGDFKYYREESKKNWGTDEDGNLTTNQIQLGAILRIADAAEKMASNYTSLQNELDRYKRWYNEEKEKSHKLERKISALRGVITKLKKSKHKSHELL